MEKKRSGGSGLSPGHTSAGSWDLNLSTDRDLCVFPWPDLVSYIRVELVPISPLEWVPVGVSAFPDVWDPHTALGATCLL